MADGILGLPPGLRGWVAADQMQQQKAANQLQQLGGILNIQNQMEMRPLQQQLLQSQVDQANQDKQIMDAWLRMRGMGGVGNVAVPAGQPGQQIPSGAGMPVGGGASGLPLDIQLGLLSKRLSPLAKVEADLMKEQQKPVVDRGFGIKVLNPVTGKYDLASNPEDIESVTAAQARGKQRVELPYRQPVSLPTSGGQNVSVFPQEFPQIQQGQVPQRLQLPQRPPAEQAALNQVIAADRAGQQANVSVPQSGMGAIPSANILPSLGQIGVTQSQSDQIRQQGQAAANTEAGKEFISEMRQNYAKLRDVPATLANIDRAKNLATTQARNFMGPFGESKLAITKFMRSNIPGMENLNTTGVTNAEELQSTLFNQVMDNLKKMDASPSQYQQQVMQEAFGTLRTDPQSVPKILDVFSDILRNRVDIHNQTVNSAESRGTAFPYDVKVNLPEKSKGLTAAEQAELQQLRSRFGR